MLWLKLGWRNLWRNPARSLVQLLVISGSLAFVIWIQNISGGTYEKMIQDAVRSGSGHLSLHHPEYVSERLTEMFFHLPPAQKLLENNPAFAHTLARLHLPALARSSRENTSVMVMGVDFGAESAVNPLLGGKRLVGGSMPEEGSRDRAYLGLKLAEKLRIKVGQKFVVMFQDFSGEISSKLYRVSGVFKSGVTQIDNTMMFVDRRHLATSLGNPDAVHEVAVVLKDMHQLQKQVAALKAARPAGSEFGVFRWEETSKQIADTIKMDQAQFKFMIFLLFVLVGLGTVNLLLMSILERTREFGLLQSLGMQKSRIRQLIFAEALVLGLTGSAMGLGFGSLASFYTWYHGLDMTAMFAAQEVAGLLFEPIIVSTWNWEWMAGLSLAMIILVLAASIYPARKALNVNPAEAMRVF